MERQRITELDLIRGFMLASMALDHGTSLTRLMGRASPSVVTLSQFLPSSTAELFFLLSGYLFGHARLAQAEAFNRQIVRDSWYRAWQLYAYNAVTLVVIAAALHWAQPVLIEASRFGRIATDPFGGLLDFMLLQTAPFGLDVLQVYIVFLMLAPAFAAVMFWRPPLAVGWLAATWLGMQVLEHTIGFAHDETIAINLWSWQSLFFGGMILGAGRAYGPIAGTILRRPAVVWAAGLVVAVLMVLTIGQRYAHWLGFPGPLWTIPSADRATLGPVRVLSFLSLLVLMIWVSRRFELVDTRIGRLFTLLGRHSLAAFCASNVGLYGVALAWQQTGLVAVYVAAEALLLGFMFAWVAFTDAFAPRRGRAADRVPSEAPQARRDAGGGRPLPLQRTFPAM
ncbi:OpgC domain-containing protein [Methylobacterium nigriterrae]|uniref:OpgC domain-containing protein n=1 Tax=Methylobacterium nigriterrae TaxID=3127512 RepID=UPI003013CCA0